jgi:hypothetical protein
MPRSQPPGPPSIIVINQGEDWAHVELTKGRWAKIDRQDIPLVTGHRWKFSAGYAYRNDRGRVILMHRLILGLGPNDPRETDHANHDGLDNRRANIRPCTPSQNQANSHHRRRSTSGYIGVYWNTHYRRWQAVIQIEGDRRVLGYFIFLRSAARAYNRAALTARGEFAVLNDL